MFTSLSCHTCPNRTIAGRLSSLQQWAAVNTNFSDINVPPHLNLTFKSESTYPSAAFDNEKKRIHYIERVRFDQFSIYIENCYIFNEFLRKLFVTNLKIKFYIPSKGIQCRKPIPHPKYELLFQTVNSNRYRKLFIRNLKLSTVHSQL